MICGVDEAGKGPVLGPLVVAAVAVDNAKDMQDLGIKDSKQLTPEKRKELSNLIKNKFSFAIEIIEAERVDEYRRQNKLNDLNREAFEKLISKFLNFIFHKPSISADDVKKSALHVKAVFKCSR